MAKGLRSTLMAAVITSLTYSSSGAVGVTPGNSVGVTVPGTTEIYAIFGHVQGGGTQAIAIDFAAGAGNILTVSASGVIGCCGGLNGSFTPDGAGGTMDISGNNSGLSSLSGTSAVPLVGVFVNADPLGNSPPAALAFDAASPAGFSPLLNQVFYVGDGRTGYNDGAGTLLQFVAPANATRLYLGVIDAGGFHGTTGFYGDNPGSFEATVSLLQPRTNVPEPATFILVGLGLAGAAAMTRRR